MGSEPKPMGPQVGAFVPLPDVPRRTAPEVLEQRAEYDRLAFRMKKRKEQLPDDIEVMIIFDWRDFAQTGYDGYGNEVTKKQLIKRLENRMGYWREKYGPNYELFRRGVVVYGRYRGPIAG